MVLAMYILRPILHDGTQVTLPACIHYAQKPLGRTYAIDPVPTPGVEVEVTFAVHVKEEEIPFPTTRSRNGVLRLLLHVPSDVDKIYVMNKDHNTVDSIQYPPKNAASVAATG
jgi:hypothetical protein